MSEKKTRREWRSLLCTDASCIRIVLFFPLLLCTGSRVSAATRYAVATGNWNSTSTWSATSGGASGASVPVAGDVVIIHKDNLDLTVTIPSGYSAACASVAIGASANDDSETLTFAASSSSLTVSGDVTMYGPNTNNGTGRTMNVNAGTLTINGNLSLSTSQTLTASDLVCKVVVTTGTVTVAGNLTFNSPSGASALQSKIDLSGGAGTFNLGGSFTISNNVGTVTPGTTSTFNFNGTSAQTIPIGVSSVVYNNLYTNNTNAGGATLSAATTSTNVTGDVRVKSGTLSNGGFAIAGNAGKTFEVANGATLKMTSTTGMATGFGTKTFGATGTVDYAGTAQTVSAESYGHLTLSNSGTKTMPGSSMTIAGNFTTSGTASATAGAGMTVNGNVSIGSGTTLGLSSFGHSFKSNITNDGTLTASTSIVTLNGSSVQSISGSASTSFNSLTVNNSNGISLSRNVTVNGTLTFTSGNVTTSSNTLSLGSSGSVSRTSGHVVGNFLKNAATGATSRTFEIGTGSNYTPVDVSFGSVTVAGNLTATTASGDHANISSSTINSSKSVNRTWTLTNSGITFTNYSATFTFVSGDVDAGATTSNFIVGKYTASSWSYPTVGTKTATSTQITGVTSFSDFQIGETSYIISGNVFEDVNYGGGAGRTKAASSGVSRSSARVELYDGSGVYSTFATTDANGDYSFTGLSAATYYVRVVNSSVTSSRSGYTASCLAVQTYRTDASSGSASAVTDYVGGTNPSVADPGNGSAGATFSTTTFVYSAVLSGTAQSVTKAVISSANITILDFGFNFNAIVSTNDAGQGSLRQFITNGNTLSGDASLAQSGLIAGKENAVLMISNGTSAAGLRSANNYFSSGIATISPTSALPTISTVVVLDAQKQPGWTSAPIIELNGTSAGSGAKGLELTGGGSTVRGFIINRFTGSSASAGIWISTTGSNTIGGNYIGTNAAGTSASANYQGIYVTGVSGNTIGGSTASQRNVLSGNTWRGIILDNGANSNTVKGNYIGVNAAGTGAVANNIGIAIWSSSSNTVGGTGAGEGNVASGNTNFGIYIVFSAGSSNAIQGNIVGLNAAATSSVPNGAQGIEICCSGDAGSNNTIGGTAAGAGNIISGNTGKGIRILGGSGDAILGNSIYNNGGIGIDLGSDGVTANNGTKNAGLPNYDMDFPVLTSAVLGGTSLTLAGYVGSAPSQSTFANARVEFFKSDNDASGYGEGQTYLGYLTADASGNFSGSLTVSGLTSGDKITGTATDGSNNTSEFGTNYNLTVTFYSKGSLAVSTASNWNTLRDGTGTNASSFSSGNLWVVQNAHAMTLTGSTTWDVSSTGTVQIESGGTWTNSSSGTVTIGTFQVDNGGSYAHGTSNALPGTTKSFGSTSTVSYYGSTQTVEALTYGHLTIASSGTRTLGGNVSVAGDLTLSGGTLDLSSYTANRTSSGGTLTVANGATLKIGGTNSIPSNYSTHSIGSTSTIEYSGTNQSIVTLNSSQSYGHLTLSGSGTKTPAAGLTIAGNFTINSGPTFSAGSFTHTIQGNFSNSGTFTAGTSTVQLTGSSDATMTGATTFNNLTVNKSSSTNTITLNNNISVGTLTMTQGKMLTGSNGVTVTSDRTGNGLIIGTITRTHAFSATTAYSFEGPYNTLTFASGGTLPTSITVTTTLSSPGSTTSMDPIDRYYTISQTGGSGFACTLRLHYEDSEVSSPNSETSPPLKIWRRTATGPDVWTREGATSNSTTNNWVEQTGLTNMGTFSLSSRTVADLVLTLAQNATNPSPGQQVTYTLSYTNSGDGTSTNTIVTGSAPANTTYVSGTTTVNGVTKTDASDADEVTVSGSTITINLGTVTVSSSGTITYKVTVN